MGAGTPIAVAYAGSLLENGATWNEAYNAMSFVCLGVLIVYFIFGDEKPEGQKSKLNIIRPLRMSKLISSEEHDRIVGSRLSTSSKNVPLSKIYTSKTVWTFTSAWFFTAFTINLFTTLPTRYSEWVSSQFKTHLGKNRHHP